MLYKNRKTLVICILIPLVLGGLSGLISRGSMDIFSTLNRPLFAPPGWLFPVVWTILYILMGIASYFVLNAPSSQRDRRRALTLYALQLVVNLLWPILFFNLSWYLGAFFWLLLLWFLVLATSVKFYDLTPRGGDLMLPYLLWVTFAAYLNWGIYQLN